MPNTLAHLGVNGFFLKKVLKNSDLKWIFISALIPDLPWIFQRFFKIFPDINLLDLRLYVIIQASLLFCIILSLALACFSKTFLKTFTILALGSLLHLILDAFQIKWGNGIHLFVPLSWSLIDFGFFWPESFPTYLLTLFGLIYVLFNWKSAINFPPDISFKPFKKIIGFIIFSSVYFLLPIFLLQYPLNANNHFVKTLENYSNRQGKDIELDRAFFYPTPEGGMIRNFAKEKFFTDGINLNHSATVSIKGIFISSNKILIKKYHVHSALFRDSSSYIGILMILLLWLFSLKKRKKVENF